MKYASQINIGIVVIALATVGYAIYETLLQPQPTALSEKESGAGAPNVSGQPGAGGSDGELPARETRKRQGAIPRPTTGLSSGHSDAVSSSRPGRALVGTPPRTRPVGKARFQDSSPPQAKVITTHPGSPPGGVGLTPRRTAGERPDEILQRRFDGPGRGSVAPGNERLRNPGRSAPSRDRTISRDGRRRNSRQPNPPPVRSSNR